MQNIDPLAPYRSGPRDSGARRTAPAHGKKHERRMLLVEIKIYPES